MLHWRENSTCTLGRRNHWNHYTTIYLLTTAMQHCRSKANWPEGELGRSFNSYYFLRSGSSAYIFPNRCFSNLLLTTPVMPRAQPSVAISMNISLFSLLESIFKCTTWISREAIWASDFSSYPHIFELASPSSWGKRSRQTPRSSQHLCCSANIAQILRIPPTESYSQHSNRDQSCQPMPDNYWGFAVSVEKNASSITHKVTLHLIAQLPSLSPHCLAGQCSPSPLRFCTEMFEY